MAKHIKELFDLTGKTAIVTGGSRGIGVEMAEALAEAGASLMLCARREEWLNETIEEFRAKNFTVEGKVCDVAKPEEVQAVVNATVDAFGKIDILINNAGISWGAMPEEMPLAQWQKVIDVNLTGCFLMAQATGREMLKNNSGSIINIASIAGLSSSANGPFYAGYAASKAGLIGFTKSIAKELGSRGITVNAIAPGFITTDMTAELGEEAKASLIGQIPLGALGEADDVADAALFLAGAGARYITGQVLNVDGGMIM